MERLRDQLTIQQRKSISIPVPDGICEKKRTDTGVVVVKAKSKEYAELLKAVKKEVGQRNVGTEVKSVRRSKEGDLLLIVDGGQDEATKMGNLIKTAISDAQVVTKGGKKEKILHVSNMDGVRTKEEIAQAIKQVVGEAGKATVKSLRPAYGGTQNATIQANEVAADKLVNIGKIKIGLVYCPIKERITPIRCFKCQEFGHIAGKCRGPDRRNHCVRNIRTMNPKKHNQSRGLRILQTNLNRMRAAHDMAFVTAVDLDIDVVVVSEPNKKFIEGKRWCKDKRQDVAILFHNQKTRIKRLDIGEGMIAIHFQSFVEKIVKGAYRGACFSKEVKSRLQPYWWNEDIDKKRRECTASRRLVTRQKHKQGDTSELEKDMWGRGYQIAVKKLIGYASFDLEPNQKKDIIRSLFPFSLREG
ncbi:hypothetical protein QE152_g10291 [Popillia japonica]|uniref:CCHC-type domain-containing protein n=1 Tax=Popillia japonica TaxID=7064 RepID=A0AAW1LS56_POPJA